ncbi:MAG TPA: S41 family peptidase [Pyrinomonadaceae bacterium]|nr:S41 family peptidase [Pyrinomonadaceae bacterium]
MKFIYALLLTLACVFTVLAQSENKPPEFNFGFEKVTAGAQLPDGWIVFGSGYDLKIDEAERKSGKYSVLIQSPAVIPEGAFGSTSFSAPANYQGKEIELRGFLKLKDVTDGFAGLFLRIDGDGGVLQFDNMQSRGLSGSKDWTEYSIKLPLPEDGSRIIFGALLTGKGQVWVDDFQILIDGKDITVSPMRPMPEYKAKKDLEFDQGSRISEIKLNAAKTDDLAILGKVWGFLKYHHPAIAAGEYNWDYELFRILPKILAAKNASERNEILSVWAESLGTFETNAAAVTPTAEKIKLNPDLAWINERNLGVKLTAQLNNIKSAKRKNKSYYIEMDPNIGNPRFKNEADYKSMNFPDAGFRLLSLYRYWNIIQYFFPNKHLIEADWNKVLPEFIPKFAGAADDLEYKKAALGLIGSISDTHANIWGRDETLDKWRGVNYAPVGVRFVEEKAVVTEIYEQTAADKAGLKIGDVIEAVGGKKVAQIVSEQLEFTPASNRPTKLRDIAERLLRTNENSLKITYRRGKVSKETLVETLAREKIPDKLRSPYSKPIPPFKLISPEIAYLYPGSLKPGEINEIIPKINGTKGLVIDLRSYPSDFIVFSLGEFLVPEPKPFVKFSVGSVENPGLFTFTEELKVGKENKNYYQGKVVILVNEITLSQAEYTTMAFRTAPRATVIGSTTAGADGNVSQFFLPGGIRTMISGIGVYYPNGKETQRIGIVPDLIVKPTVKGIAEGKDEPLEKAIEIINGK